MVAILLPFVLVLLTALISLIILAYHRPGILKTPPFIFTRKCLGLAILSYAAAVILTGASAIENDLLGFSMLAHFVAWIGLFLALRGVFELLAEDPR